MQAGVLEKRLVCFSVDEPGVALLGRETILRNGERVGWLSSGGYGHHVGAAIGLGYIRNQSGVDSDFITSGQYQLEVADRRVDCQLHTQALYDPHNKRIHG